MLFLRLFQESILMALHAMKTNKLRTFLSLLGISIGIFAIISVFTVSDGLERSIRKDVESLGSNVIYIQKWPWSFGDGGEYPWWKYWQRPLPGYNEMTELQKRTQTVEALAYVAFGNKPTKAGSTVIENTVIGAVSHDYYRITPVELINGRYFSQQESESGKNVAIIGYDVAINLFGDVDCVGEQIQTLGRKFNVIGIYKKEGNNIFGDSNDNQVTIPVNYARNLLNLRSDRINPFIQAKAKPGITNKQMEEDLRANMRAIRKLRPSEADNFALNESSMLTGQIESLFQAIGVAGWVIGGFSILVGGFGIANIMFVSVKERTGIIGIQKSLGAKNYFILLQFLIESVVLCITGGLLGLLIVFILSFIATGMMDFDVNLTLFNILYGLFISTIIGVLSGFMPAYSASRLDPVEAIRSNQ
ncbi:MAG: ABC transporter permease [Bacteroidia bacterium]|nr:ABC transporter permease [Bacteroidia bacterium]MCZ2277872.1 ABC transporter permease [Bacteroidia bacterium]